MSVVDPKVRRLHRRLCSLVAAVAMADFLFGAVFVVHMRSVGVNPVAVGGLLALARGLSTLAEAPSGALGDRYGQKRIMVAGLAAWGLGQILFGFAEGTAMFVVALVLWSGGMAFYSGAPFALVVSTLRAHGAQDRVALVVRHAQVARWVAAGAGAGIVLAAGSTPTGVVVIAAGAVLLLTAGWVLARWTESPVRSDRSVGATLLAGVRTSLSGEPRTLLLLSSTSAAATAAVLLGWQPLALAAGLPQSALGLLLLAMTAAAAAGAAASSLTERVPALALTVTVLLLCAALCAAALGGVIAVAALLLAEVLVGLSMATSGVWAQLLYPDDMRNTLMSVLGVATGLSMALVNLAFGAVWERHGLGAAYVAVGGAVAVLTVLTAMSSRTTRGRHAASGSAPRLDDVDTPAA